MAGELGCLELSPVMGAKMTERRVDKPWGCEVIWAETEKFAGKLIYIKKGHKLSLQYHDKKRESFIVDRGRLKFHWKEVGDSVLRTMVMIVGDHFDIPREWYTAWKR